MFKRGTTTTTILLLLGTLASGCSGGSGSEPDVILGGGGGSTLYVPSFQPDQPAPGSGTVAMEQAIALGDAVTVAIGVTGATNVQSASMEITFDPIEVEYVDWSCGDLLFPCPGAMLVDPNVPGHLLIGVAQLGSGPGVDVTGTKTLIRLTFRAIGPGPSQLDFDPTATALLDPDLQDIPGIEWSGGWIVTN